ncbi:hypothetical protein C8Q77DRAFT_600541 [Trametes polyzona]|nr:hypothetical protein C8Q77DRAFT_600541 [Trametes polyzona]
MLSPVPASLAVVAALASAASAHVAFWHPSMYGFNVTDKTYSYDNRPQVPLYDMTFDQWWFHGHIDHPPNDGDLFDLKAGGTVNTILSCDKGATLYYNSSEGGDVGFGSDSPCPGAPLSAFHTTGEDDVKGCGLAIAYKSDVHDVQPEDFAIFSINQTCVWWQNTSFDVPNLPACPEGGCHCAWFWIHSIDSGAEQIYMNGFKCKVSGDVGSQPIGKPAVPRRCGADPDNGFPDPRPGNCTIGAKQPLYWYQKERNNMPEDTYHAPYYNDLYGFHDGAQNDVFQDGVIASLAGSAPTSAPTTQTIPPAQPTTTAQSSPSQAPQPPAQSPSEAPASPTTTQADPTTPASTQAEPTPSQAPPTTIARVEPTTSNTPEPVPTTTFSVPVASVPTQVAAAVSTSIAIEPVTSSSSSSSSETTPSSTAAATSASVRRCKPRPTNAAAQLNKRKHARHLSGLRHAH